MTSAFALWAHLDQSVAKAREYQGIFAAAA